MSCAVSDDSEAARYFDPDAGLLDEDRPNEAYDDEFDDLEDTIGETFYPDVGSEQLPAEDPYVDPLPHQLEVEYMAREAAGIAQIDVKPYRSVLITEPRAVRAIGNRFPLGVLLNRVGKAAIRDWSKADGSGTTYRLSQRNRWVEHPFRVAAREFFDHNELGSEKRLGMKHNGNPLQRVQNLWPQLDNSFVGRGPFRLLAVVNRLDLAGDVDDRGIIDAAKAPRSFGEARLIFGLVDKEYERNQGKPYPMTFIIEYRLPALNKNYMPIKNYDYEGNLFNREEWRTQMQRWGHMWRKLSSWDQTGSAKDVIAYRRHLKRIVGRFARPENFVALRSNVELKQDGKIEYELREWYMLKGNNWILIPRKPRDETYKCMGNGAEFSKLLHHYWDPAKNDLNMARVTPDNPTRVIGYNVPRSTGRLPGGLTMLDNPYPGCPSDGKFMTQFEMSGTNRDGTKADPGNIGDGTTRFVPPFGRAKENTLWNPQNVSEDQRHQFAMRTCTGCHSQEAGVFGFHVFPRLAGKQAKLSNFLTGGASFANAGRQYNYNEMAARKGFLEKASTRDPGLELFEGLYRHD